MLWHFEIKDTAFGYLGGAEDHYTNENGGCGACGSHVDLWRNFQPALGENGTEFMAYKYNAEAAKLIMSFKEKNMVRNGTTFVPGTDKRFFLYLALQCAHAPNEADTFVDLYTDSKYTKDYANYNGMISAIDSVVGKVEDLYYPLLFVIGGDRYKYSSG